jgi:hypothetical protein
MSKLLKTVHLQRPICDIHDITGTHIQSTYSTEWAYIAYLLNGASVGTLEKGPHHSNTFQ